MTLCRRKIELAATLEKATNVVIRYERAQGLLLADCAPTVGWGKTFWRGGRLFFTKTGVTRKRKVDKWIRRCQIGCPGSRPEACLAWSQHKNVTYWVSSHDSNKKFGPFLKKKDFGPKNCIVGPKFCIFFMLHL